MVENMNRMIQSLKVELEAKECKNKDRRSQSKENEKEQKIEKEVSDLKDEVSTLKQMFAKMYKLIESRKANKVEPDVKRKENENENEEVEESKIKCDRCEYKTTQRTTLRKHMNTKHGQTEI